MSALFGLIVEFLVWFIFEMLIGAIVEGFKAVCRAFFPAPTKLAPTKRNIKFKLTPNK
ncbi:hypothetical protein [Pedobacter frigoris]|uniref:hypothetical protein n=1 Tax=Pedobacter frigoris TaxID=2571272 RepID=UPI00292D0077|nr:hypothetical protein [Pedobacter frigoris]